jgi:hypothetical protein
MTERRLAPTLRNLALALLNATLILAALVLWLAWRTADAVHDVTDDVDLALVGLDPVRDDLALLVDEVTALRADLAALSSAGAGLSVPGTLGPRIEALDARLTEALARVDRLSSEPGALVDLAVGSLTESLTRSVARLRNCTLPDAG